MELTNKNIDGAIKDIRAFFENAKVPHKDVLKICLVVEEALLRYQEKFGSKHEFNLYTKKWFSAPKIIIQIKGELFYPLKNDSDDDTSLSNDIMQSLLHFDEANDLSLRKRLQRINFLFDEGTQAAENSGRFDNNRDNFGDNFFVYRRLFPARNSRYFYKRYRNTDFVDAYEFNHHGYGLHDIFFNRVGHLRNRRCHHA